jgi:hypothetical protein
MTEPAKQIDDLGQLDEMSICYWKVQANGWYIYLPGCGITRLTNHQIEEHEDGTISVTPSIVMRCHINQQRHGDLTHGEWRELAP